jgi:uncharacterized membrane protein YeaQ/YmgE (transglycosylase-associated protein family)
MHYLWSAIVGIVAGWLAGQIVKGSGFGLLGNLVVGILGAIAGAVIFGVLGFEPTHLVGRIISATVGAVVLLALLVMFVRKRA